jgi:hypothetical protein
MGRRKPTPPPPKTKVMVDLALTMKATHENYDARLARVSPDTALALDYAIDRLHEISAVNPIHLFRDHPGGRLRADTAIREAIFHATCDAFKTLHEVRYGVHVLIRRDAE